MSIAAETFLGQGAEPPEGYSRYSNCLATHKRPDKKNLSFPIVYHRFLMNYDALERRVASYINAFLFTNIPRSPASLSANHGKVYMQFIWTCVACCSSIFHISKHSMPLIAIQSHVDNSHTHLRRHGNRGR